MSLWFSGACSTAVAVDIKYPVGATPEEPEYDLQDWIDYYEGVYDRPAEAVAAAEAARDKAQRDREATEAARLRSEYATTPGRLTTRIVTPEELDDLILRLRREAAEIDGDVRLGLPDVAGQSIEVAFPAEVRPELIRGTLRLALGRLGTDLDRLWAGVERLFARVAAQGGDITERRALLFVPARGYELDQRHRMLVPIDQAKEVIETRGALDRAIEQAKSARDREKLEELREQRRGARALVDLAAAEEARREAERQAEVQRQRERDAEERIRAAEEEVRQAREEAAQARAEAARLEEERRREASVLREELAEAEQRRVEAERARALAEERADLEARERRATEEELGRFRARLGLPEPGAVREEIPVAERKRRKKKSKAKKKTKRT